MLEEKTRYHFDNNYLHSPLKFGDINMVQIGRRYCEPSSVIDAHSHENWFELTLVTAGKGSIITNGDPCEVMPRDIYLSFPGDIHEIRASGVEKLEYDYLSFFTDDTRMNERLELVIRHNRDSASRRFTNEKISFLINCALAEFTKKQEYSDELLSGIFRQIVIYLIRDFSGSISETADVSDARILCLQLMNYLDAHIYSSESLSETAKKFSYNYSYLSSLFRKTTGKNLSDYYRERKMETAKVLLLDEKKKLCDISQMLGYSSQFALSRAFSKSFGMSPREYRARMGVGDNKNVSSASK